MKNANVFVDVDLTLVDANGKLLSGAREALLSDAADAAPRRPLSKPGEREWVWNLPPCLRITYSFFRVLAFQIGELDRLLT